VAEQPIDKFPITVMVDGRPHVVPGWVMVRALASAGVEWAQREVETDLREKEAR
jgi:hypothetical protein